MKIEIIIAGALISFAILLDGHLERKAKEAQIDRCVTYVMEKTGRTDQEAIWLWCIHHASGGLGNLTR